MWINFYCLTAFLAFCLWDACNKTLCWLCNEEWILMYGTKFQNKNKHTLNEDHKPSWIHCFESVHFCFKNSAKNTSSKWNIFHYSRATEIVEFCMLMNRMTREKSSMQVANHHHGQQINSNEQTKHDWLLIRFCYLNIQHVLSGVTFI